MFLSLMFCLMLSFSVYAGVNERLEDKYTLYIHVITVFFGVLTLISIMIGY